MGSASPVGLNCASRHERAEGTCIAHEGAALGIRAGQLVAGPLRAQVDPGFPRSKCVNASAQVMDAPLQGMYVYSATVVEVEHMARSM